MTLKGNSIPALTTSGNTRGDLYLQPIWNQPAQPWDGQGVQLLTVEAQHQSAESLGVNLRWGVGKSLPANYKIALRLHDPTGRQWAELDTQPGYGFYPTSVWQAGTSFSEQCALTVPDGLSPGDYQLTVFSMTQRPCNHAGDQCSSHFNWKRPQLPTAVL